MRDNPVLAIRSKENVIAAPTGPRRKARAPTDPGPFRSRSLAPIGWVIAAVFAGVALLVYFTAPDYRPIKVRDDVASERPIPPPPALPPPPKAVVVVEPETPNDPLGRTRDLRAVYMRYRDSTNPIERALAGRAHRACFPAFMPPKGQAPSTVHLVNALPREQRELRQAAIEELFARCRAFLAQPLDPAEIVATAERVTSGDLATPGAAARWAMMRGDRPRADRLIEAALKSREPYAVQSLVGMSTLMMDHTSQGMSPDVTDAALALVACDLGAACGRDSLIALQLCMAEGRCEGTARERMVERIGQVDMEAVQRERERLRILIERGNGNISSVWRTSPR